MKKLIVLMAAMVTFASTVFAEIGSLSSDLVFTPVTPCRILDTRFATTPAGTPIAAGTKRDFVAWTSNYAVQGGSPTNCNMLLSTNVAAVAVNFTVVSPTTGGYITAFPFGAAQPTAATVNFNAGDIRGNFAIFNISQAGGSFDLSVFSTSTTHLVGDIVGYYAKPIATALECVTTAATTVAVAAGVAGAGAAPACAASYTSTGIFCNTDSADLLAYAFTSGSCAARNFGAASHSLYVSQRCCRIPGR